MDKNIDSFIIKNYKYESLLREKERLEKIADSKMCVSVTEYTYNGRLKSSDRRFYVDNEKVRDEINKLEEEKNEIICSLNEQVVSLTERNSDLVLAMSKKKWYQFVEFRNN